MNALGLSVLSLVVLALLAAPRRWALLAMVVGALYLPQGMQVSVGGFNLFALRIVELAGIVRVLGRRELAFSGFNTIDRTLVLFTIYTTTVFLTRSSVDQAYEIGRTIDTCFCYFTFRGLVRNVDEFKWFLRAFVLPLIPYVALVFVERQTFENPFNSYLSGTAPFVLREGEVRAVGSFQHPSLLGTLGGTFFALYVGLWMSKGSRLVAAVGIVISLAIVLAANSGAPLSCVLFATVGWLCWGFRSRMKEVRIAIVVGLTLLTLSMKAPVWYVLARFSELTGGDGFHRSYLLDIAFQNLDKWWLAGMAISDTKDWFPYINHTTGGADMTNQFLVWGMTAGLGAMALWILLLKRAFSNVGRAIQILRERDDQTRDAQYICWSLGVLLVVHVMNWMSIPYFDQSAALWLLELAVIVNLTEEVLLGHNRIHSDSGQVRLAELAPQRLSLRATQRAFVRPSVGRQGGFRHFSLAPGRRSPAQPIRSSTRR